MSSSSTKLIILFILGLLLIMWIQPSDGDKQKTNSSQRNANEAKRKIIEEVHKSNDSIPGKSQQDKSVSWRKIGSKSRDERKKRKQKDSVLKTSMKAKTITETRYLKKDWCKSQPVRQKIKTRNNCLAVVINQFCFGQCNSFYIPKDITTDPDREPVPDYFKSCSFCKAKKEEWISVRLRCKNIRKTRMPRFIIKKMKRIKGCTCIAVPDLDMTNTDEVILSTVQTTVSSTRATTPTSTAFSKSQAKY